MQMNANKAVVFIRVDLCSSAAKWFSAFFNNPSKLSCEADNVLVQNHEPHTC